MILDLPSPETIARYCRRAPEQTSARARNIARGLTYDGNPRKRGPYKPTGGATPEERFAIAQARHKEKIRQLRLARRALNLQTQTGKPLKRRRNRPLPTDPQERRTVILGRHRANMMELRFARRMGARDTRRSIRRLRGLLPKPINSAPSALSC